MEAWPQLRAAPAPGMARVHWTGGLEEEDEGPTPICVVRRSVAVNDLEQRLQFSMVAYVGGSRPAVSCGQALEAIVATGVLETEVSIHRFAPEDFLVVFGHAEHKARVAAWPLIEHAGFSLFFRQWNQQAQAEQASLGSKVHQLLEGVSPHAWDIEVVKDLLGNSCTVEEITPETRSHRDLSSFKLTVWTSELEAILVARTLAIPEPVEVRPHRDGRRGSPPAEEVSKSRKTVLKVLKYKVIIHVTRVEEDALPEEWFLP
uniref:Uncharacterized protein n=1 Tax=Avena sativa TaxID=4498 RepID=A0ACD5YJY4_AVESA